LWEMPKHSLIRLRRRRRLGHRQKHPLSRAAIQITMSLVAIDLFTALVALLRLDRQRRDRPCIEPLQADGFAGFLAKTISAIVKTLPRGVDLGDQLALAIARPEFDGTVGFGGGPVGEIGVVGAFF